MKHIYLLLIAVFMISGKGIAQQNIEFNKNNFSDKNKLNIAVSNLKKGDKYYTFKDYENALKYYLAANEINPSNAILNYKIGVCYYRTNYNQKAKKFFQNASLLDPNVSIDIHFMLAAACQASYRFDSAIIEFKVHKKSLNSYDTIELKKVEKRIDECFAGMQLIRRPKEVTITNISSNINSLYPEYGGLVAGNKNMIFFTSCRPNSLGGLKRFSDNDYFEDIYYSTRNGDNWQPPQNLSKLNSRTNDATTGISPDGKTIYIFRDKNGGDLLFAKFKDNKWTNPEFLPSPINTEYFEAYASITSDGKTFYFISDRPGGIGGKDIYTSKINSDGSFTKPENLGSLINTPYDEICVSVSPDGRMLYFSSQGHNAMGGFDIFVAQKDEKGKWKTPKNIGFPINSPNDDVFYHVADSATAYFSTIKEGKMSDYDIFMIKQVPDVSPSEIIAQNVAPETLKFLYSKGKGYAQNVTASGFLFTFNDLSISIDSIIESKETLINYEKKKLAESRRKIPVINIKVHFEYGGSEIQAKYLPLLDSIAGILKERKDIRIVISGHSDNTGPLTLNQELSLKRAQNVADYLIAKAIERKRIDVAGKFYSEPIDTNDTPDGRSKNRRVDFKCVK